MTFADGGITRNPDGSPGRVLVTPQDCAGAYRKDEPEHYIPLNPSAQHTDRVRRIWAETLARFTRTPKENR